MAHIFRRKLALCALSSQHRSSSFARTFSSSLPRHPAPLPLSDLHSSAPKFVPHHHLLLLREPSPTKPMRISFVVPSRLLASRRNTTAAIPPPEPSEEYTGDLDVEEAMADLNMSSRLDDKMYDYSNYGAGQEEDEGEYEEEEPAPDPEADALFSPAEED